MPWAHNINPDLVTRDLTTFYVATNLLPSGVAGIIFCGVFSWLISLILMVVVSLATQKDKVPLGYFQVFFCDDYDEKYAKNFRLSNKDQ